MRIAVAGASGFVGRNLVPALVDAGHDVYALTRHPEDYDGPGEPVFADVSDASSLPDALEYADAAYYLVHSLDRRDFVEHDAQGARDFGDAAAHAGVRRIVYLGGLGDPGADLSKHLHSRQQVEGMLGAAGVPVTTLRAGIVIGDGSTSWALIRRMVELVPVLVMPTWANTRTQPIAIDDAVRYLVGVLDVDSTASHVYEIGGSEVLRYHELLSRLSRMEGRPPLQVRLPVPFVGLAAFAASRVLPIVTGVDAQTVRTLIESMPVEVVVHDYSVRLVVPFEPMDYDQAMLAALSVRAKRSRAG